MTECCSLDGIIRLSEQGVNRMKKDIVKLIFFAILGEDWYRLRQRLLICIRNLELWAKNQHQCYRKKASWQKIGSVL